MRVPPSQSLTMVAVAASACARCFSRIARVTRVSRVPNVNTSMRSTACASACAMRRCVSVRSFIEPDTSISSRTRRCRGRRFSRRNCITSPSLRTASRKVRRVSKLVPRRARMRR